MQKDNVTKEVLSVSIDKKVLKKFNELCEKNSINKSRLTEKLINNHLEGKK